MLQIVVFPLFIEGVESPADDILDFGIGAVLVALLGWHWEFLPSFFGKLLPGVDLVPFWTMAVANVYRKQKRIAVATVGAWGAADAKRAVEFVSCEFVVVATAR